MIRENRGAHTGVRVVAFPQFSQSQKIANARSPHRHSLGGMPASRPSVLRRTKCAQALEAWKWVLGVFDFQSGITGIRRTKWVPLVDKDQIPARQFNRRLPSFTGCRRA